MHRCSACPGVNNCVPPSGPNDGDIRFIGEAPGKDENKRLIPFVGRTGQEVNEHYLPLAGLRRDTSTFDNVIKCLPVSSNGRLDIKRQKDLDLLQSCAEAHLYPTLERTQPKLIVPMGTFACRAIDPNINLDLHHGIPIQTRFGVAFPMWHPAGGVHEPKKMLQIRNDWIRLRRYMLGKLHVPVDAYPDPDYKEADTADIKAIDPTIPMGSDTESSRSMGPYCYTYSQYPGTARLIRAENRYHLELLQEKMAIWESILLFHNWLYDRGVTWNMGLRIPDRKVRDTMVKAFLLGNLPQGLKALAYRELGMEMVDFDDLVVPYSKMEVLRYYHDAYAIPWPKPQEQTRRGDDGKWKLYKPQSMTTKFKRFFTDYGKNPETKDVIEMWDNWEDNWAAIEEQVGPWPGKDIAHVPFEEALHYACRDSDATLRIWPVLRQMERAIRTGPQENWRRDP